MTCTVKLRDRRHHPDSAQPSVQILPSTIKLEPVPSKAASAVPALKGYTFAIVNGKLLILNPPDKKIIDVVTG
jgi:hypothetical protein